VKVAEHTVADAVVTLTDGHVSALPVVDGPTDVVRALATGALAGDGEQR
jgi:CBS domain-containing protein